MARAKEFDPDTALRKALDLFWSRGYEATSTDDLVRHLGVARSSIYATFGNKHDLYVKALELYVQTRPDLFTLFAQPGPVLPAVCAVIRSFLAEAISDQGRRGCFIVNAATECLPGDPAVERCVESGWNGLELAFRSAFARAIAQGELPADRDPQALARFFLLQIEGLRVVAKGAPDRSRLSQAIEQALTLLG